MSQTAEHLEKQKARRSLLQSAGLIGFFTLMSRVLGLARDIVSAGVFGTSGAWDAFLYAFTIPNFLRRLVGEGALSSAFIPVYTEVLREKGREEADKVANIVSSLLSVFLAVLILAVLAAIQVLLRFAPLPDKIILTLKLLRILFPYVFFLAHVALSMGILNCHKHFFTPSLSPVILNIVWLAAVVFLCPWSGTLEGKAHLLAAAILLTGIIQLGLQFFPLHNFGYRMRWSFEFFHPSIRKICKLIVPAVMGFAVTQISILIDMTLAFFCGDGANASLWYGNRLMQFPLGLFGIAMGTALLPEFSGHAAEKNLDKLRETLSFSLRQTFLIVIPAACGLIFLKTPIVHVLFERGNFDAESTFRTANTVMFYSIGLFAYSGQQTMSSAFYAIQDTKTPFKLSALSIAVDAVLGLILMIPMKEAGLALSTAVGGILNFTLQLILLNRKIQGIDLRNIIFSFLRITGVSVAMGISAMLLYRHIQFTCFPELVNSIAGLTSAVTLGIGIYAAFLFIFRVHEVHELIGVFKHTPAKKTE